MKTSRICMKTCSLLEKLILTERIILFKVNAIILKYRNTSANYKNADICSSAIQLHGVDMIDMQIQN